MLRILCMTYYDVKLLKWVKIIKFELKTWGAKKFSYIFLLMNMLNYCFCTFSVTNIMQE